MRTTEYPYYRPPFSDFNVAQEAVVPFLAKDVNLVISFATAVGKTVLAECCFGYHLSTDELCRVAYVCPTRSLGSEKSDEWKDNTQLCDYGIVLSTGDTVPTQEDYETSRIAILTSESFDSKSRSSAWKSWMRSFACVVFDEAHLIGDPTRGGSVESSMMRLSKLNSSCRLVLLSATLGNAVEVAKWVKSLNGKETKCIESSWRPTQIDMDYCVIADADEKVDEAVRLAVESSLSKTVVFVHSKNVGRQILNRLRSKRVKCAFHNASVSAANRRKIEAAFNDRMSGLNVLISTSTLGAGVNIGG